LPRIAPLLAHRLAARPLPPAYGLGNGAKPPENRQSLPVAALHQLWQDGAGMNESEKQFSFTREASSTSGRAKNQILISKNVTGTLRVKLYKGNIMCAGRKSPVSLYNPAIATMEADPTKAYNQDDATGFIRLNALRLKVAARVQRRK
jgi:hypothetical protein